MNQCDVCEEMGCKDCINCPQGNPCIDCDDYDRQNDRCKSNGGCAELDQSARLRGRAIKEGRENGKIRRHNRNGRTRP